MKSQCVLPLVTLVMLLPTTVRAEDHSTRDAASKSDQLPWVTQQVEAPRVSFHTFRSRAAKSEVSYHGVRTAQPPLAAGVKPLRSLFPATCGLPCGGPAW